MVKSFMLFLFALLLALPSSFTYRKPAKKSSLINKTYEILKKNKFARSNVGFYLVDLKTNKIIIEHNADKTFIPASTIKVPTTLMALETLGFDHRFKTTLAHSGTIEDGTLKGDLFLIGGGDPFLTSSELFSFAQKIQALGIKKIKGSFYYDDQFLTKTKILNEDVPDDQTYNPGVSALSSNFNRFTLWQRGKKRRTKQNEFSTVPYLPSFMITKTKKSFRSIANLKSYSLPMKEMWTLSLQKKYPHSLDLPVRKPSLFTASILQKFSKQLGVNLPHPAEWKKPLPEVSEISATFSKELIELSGSTLEYSNNLLAELILLNAVKEWKSKKCSLSESGSFLKEWLKKKISTVNWKNASINNGSGLDYYGAITPKQMTKVLEFAQNRFYGSRSYWSLLSLSGQKGWLRKRLKSPEYAYRLWGKTGSLDYVSNITGYFFSKKNRKIAFTLFMTNRKKRNLINEMPKEKSGPLRKLASKWNRNTKKLQNTILKSWIDQN